MPAFTDAYDRIRLFVGSKGIKDKNIRLLNGKPLMAYAIESALESQYIDEVMVSTDRYHIYATPLISFPDNLKYLWVKWKCKRKIGSGDRKGI